jgi:uncharacterized membrane protein
MGVLGIGAVCAVAVLEISIVSLLMAMWRLIGAGGLVLASIQFLIGLAIVRSVLGHATQHL